MKLIIFNTRFLEKHGNNVASKCHYLYTVIVDSVACNYNLVLWQTTNETTLCSINLKNLKKSLNSFFLPINCLRTLLHLRGVDSVTFRWLKSFTAAWKKSSSVEVYVKLSAVRRAPVVILIYIKFYKLADKKKNSSFFSILGAKLTTSPLIDVFGENYVKLSEFSLCNSKDLPSIAWLWMGGRVTQQFLVLQVERAYHK